MTDKTNDTMEESCMDKIKQQKDSDPAMEGTEKGTTDNQEDCKNGNGITMLDFGGVRMTEDAFDIIFARFKICDEENANED